MLTVADPMVLIGLLIGGAVPFLFSSMLIRAVGRAAFFIVKECRIQFRDPEIWAGTKKPDYGRVVDICTDDGPEGTDRPGLAGHPGADRSSASCSGRIALGGFLAGMILVGQLLAVFMANAGGAWDNAKKMIEDEPRTATTGKGSEKHKAAVTGDTVGDPLKDTAGPAINPLIKVMNMVSLLGLGLVLSLQRDGHQSQRKTSTTIGLSACSWRPWPWPASLWAVWRSKHESAEMTEIVGGLEDH